MTYDVIENQSVYSLRERILKRISTLNVLSPGHHQAIRSRLPIMGCPSDQQSCRNTIFLLIWCLIKVFFMVTSPAFNANPFPSALFHFFYCLSIYHYMSGWLPSCKFLQEKIVSSSSSGKYGRNMEFRSGSPAFWGI